MTIAALSRLGPLPALRTELVAELGERVVAAAEASSVLLPASPAELLECEEPEPCAGRRVVRVGPGRPLVVCSRREHTCDDVRVSEETIARRSFDDAAFAQVLARASRCTGEVARLMSGSFALGSRGDERAFWMRASALVSELPPGPCLVLTGSDADAEVVQRVRGVRVHRIEDALRVGKAGLAAGLLSPPRRMGQLLELPVPKPAPPKPPPYPVPATFAELRLRVVDGHTLEVRVANRRARVTYADLGMRHARTKAPDRSWLVLLKICTDGGRVAYHEIGKTTGTAREAVSRLRAKLRAAFPGAEGDPLVAGKRGGWKATFAASADRPAFDDE